MAFWAQSQRLARAICADALGPAGGAHLSYKGLALLAGRKLLLADDSVTIQKVIDLTFADEGVKVIAFGNGREAIEQIEEIAPDVVLADVFMPQMNGYEVCQYIKENEKLRHIPVMLLVGSFEPFDEAEARRVGADDILTKPFQSIRRLIDRVGALVNDRPSDEQRVTAELPKAEEPVPEAEKLSTQELEMTTADTLSLPADMHGLSQEVQQESLAGKSTWNDEQMQSPTTELTRQTSAEPADGLLDLGEFDSIRSTEIDDFAFELDLDEPSDVVGQGTAYEASSVPAAVEAPVFEAAAAVANEQFSYQPEIQREEPSQYATHQPAYEDQVHEVAAGETAANYKAPESTLEVAHEYPGTSENATELAATASAATQGSDLVTGNFPPGLIDAIARRAVEHLSDKVIREIAWEVVPELAELLIKRQLEEKESQPK